MAQIEHFYAAIMAGGGGTRLWPMSRAQRPKQLLRLIGDRSLYRLAVDRLEPLMPADAITVLTIPELVPALRSETPELPEQNYFIEPAPRGNAAAIGLAALRLARRDDQAVMACLTADHIIRNETRFCELLAAAYEAARDGSLITLGIHPEQADPGFGYIQRGEPAGSFAGMPAFRVQAFIEKPPLEQAREYVADGGYDWNSGMFVWRVDAVLAEIERQMPALASALQEIEPALGGPDEQGVIERVWPALEKLSIDYGIMEGAREVLVIPARELGWYDVGDWSRLFDLLEPDDEGNVARGVNLLLRSSRNSLVVRQEAAEQSERLVVLLGAEDLIVIDTGDVVLVCDRSHAAEVKHIVDELTRMGMERYL